MPGAPFCDERGGNEGNQASKEAASRARNTRRE